MYGALYGACMVHIGPLRTISQRCMVHVQYIHDQDYIQRRRTIHPFQNNRWLGLSSNKKTALVDKTVLKATLLCV